MISPYQRSLVLIRKRDSSGNELAATFLLQNGESRISTQQKLRTSWTWRVRIPSQTPGVSQSIWSTCPRAIDVSEYVA
jgi:hypothetical protein